MNPKPVALVILDGFGYTKDKEYNAIFHAHTPHLDAWWQHYPHTLLHAAGEYVGLPPGLIGNSEVGHVTIGAGRIIKQPITVMHEAIADKSFFKNPVLVEKLTQLQHSGAPLHIMGLLSDAGVHSTLATLYAFLDAAHQHNIRHVFIHPFLDGRDAPPRSAVHYLEQLDHALTSLEYGSLGSLHGRFYAMDRDHHWDRTAASYTVLTSTQDLPPLHWQDVVEDYYAQGITDEFIPPTRLDPTSFIESGDGIIFLNVRPDRARQLTAAFVEPHFNHFATKKLQLSCFITPTKYGAALPTDVMFPKNPVTNTLKDALVAADKTVFTIAETEKYAHVTYFFGGGHESAYPHETRVLIPSKGLRSYAEDPTMSAPEITHAVLNSLDEKPCDFYLINYANADMVGHSGDFQATVKAIECLDTELHKLFDNIVMQRNGIMIVTADHGKAEQMVDPKTGQPYTAHTTNKVPCIVLAQQLKDSGTQLPLEQLADLKSYIMQLMHIDK